MIHTSYKAELDTDPRTEPPGEMGPEALWGQEWAGGHRRELDLQPPLGYMGVPRWPVFCPNSSAGCSFYRNQPDAALGTTPLSWPHRNAAPEEAGCPSKSRPLPPGPTPSLPKAPGWYSTAAQLPSSRDMMPTPPGPGHLTCLLVYPHLSSCEVWCGRWAPCCWASGEQQALPTSGKCQGPWAQEPWGPIWMEP